MSEHIKIELKLYNGDKPLMTMRNDARSWENGNVATCELFKKLTLEEGSRLELKWERSE